MTDHVRIWLEPEPGSDPDCGRMWAQNDVWGDGTEYIMADTIAAALSAAEQRGRDAEREKREMLENAILRTIRGTNHEAN